jgi:hypothetical protein
MILVLVSYDREVVIILQRLSLLSQLAQFAFHGRHTNLFWVFLGI